MSDDGVNVKVGAWANVQRPLEVRIDLASDPSIDDADVRVCRQCGRFIAIGGDRCRHCDHRVWLMGSPPNFACAPGEHRFCDADGNRVYDRCQKCGVPERLAAPRVEHVGSIRVVGRWRVYFHRANPDGLPWCVAPDAGGWEIAVRLVSIVTPSTTVFTPKATPDDDDGRPSAWIEASGVLVVDETGCARIEAAP